MPEAKKYTCFAVALVDDRSCKNRFFSFHCSVLKANRAIKIIKVTFNKTFR